MTKPVVDFNAIDAATPGEVAKGHRLFTSHVLFNDAPSHITTLLAEMRVPPRGSVVDMGCGIGEFERFAGPQRPDVRWYMVNLSTLQLSMCPKSQRYVPVFADAHATGLPNDTFDRALFHTSLVQMDMAAALHEAHRILKPGGEVFLWELIRRSGNNDAWMSKLGGYVPYRDELLDTAEVNGFKVIECKPRSGSDNTFRALLGADKWMLDEVSSFQIRLRKLPQTNSGG